MTRGETFLKRLIDILGSVIGLILFFPLLLVAGIAIRLDSPGRIFFVQKRAGLCGQVFQIIKLRTMLEGAEDQLANVIDRNNLQGPVYKIQQDPRVTSVGRFLRRWSIDELPQFWNVLVGEMSLVGPRPEELWVVERYNPEQRKRLLLKPGMTGPVQVNGRGDLDFDERFRLEMAYFEHRSIGLDVKIILQTVGSIIRGRGAY